MPSDPEKPPTHIVNTGGGDYAEGTIDKRQGTFVTEEQSYNVAGFANPYMGLRAFTAAERDIFAGRERIVAALAQRLAAEDGDRLLFIVGASGSGKSSLVRAGLIPALIDGLNARGMLVHSRSVDAIGHGGLVAELKRWFQDTAHTQPNAAPTWYVLLLDQFEELFSQAAADERDQALSLLITYATATAPCHIRIIATMRSDFLPHLVADLRFEAYERRKVVVRAMTPEELVEAIERPIQMRHPGKRLEPALVKRLAHDASRDAAYLPLLQVTLEELWRGGDLRLGAYHGLADAIQRRADAEAEALKQHQDGIFLRAGVEEFYLSSLQQRNEAQRKQMRHTYMVFTGLSILTLIALIAASLAGWFGLEAQERRVAAEHTAATAIVAQDQAYQQAQIARIRELIAQATASLQLNRPQLAGLLVLEAYQTMANTEPAITMP
ncbi:nSTAND1 domain-containing NTPase [Candidatus Viridilinea mediisalina]|nr:ATP-binding protein [Candidatus Viridilinea mediisalina]